MEGLARFTVAEGAGRSILVVDDDARILALLSLILTREGFEVREARSAEEATAKLRVAAPDLILLDLNLPGSSGLSVLRLVRGSPETRLIPVVMMTGMGTREAKQAALAEGVTDFLSKPFSPEELLPRVRALIKLKVFSDSLEDSERIVVALARVVDARDPFTARHSVRVAHLGGLLAERIGLHGLACSAVRRGGLFHDIGKIAVRDAVLLKTGELTNEEREEMRRHTVEGKRLIGSLRTFAYAVDVVYYHHERWDGSGYPEGLAGESIPLAARITTIADVFDALTSRRPYRAAYSQADASEIMASEAARGLLDRRLVDEFHGLLSSLPAGLPEIPQTVEAGTVGVA